MAFITHHSSFVIAFALGAASVAGYAPLDLFPLPLAALACLFLLWSRAPSPRAAAVAGFAYGLGTFLAGVSWVYVSLHDFGAMPAPLAAAATLLFCMVLALLPAAAGWLHARIRAPEAPKLAAAAPALWVLAEWTRGWIFTGFPWLALGYSQVPASPLAGFAPVIGVYGVSLAAAVTAGLIAVLWRRWRRDGEFRARNARWQRGPWRVIVNHSSLILVLALVWAGGYALSRVDWTRPTGEPLPVSLVQGNVAQDLKWRGSQLAATLETYRRLVAAAPGRLVVLPETALPLFLDQVPPDYLASLAARARVNGGDLLVGVPERLAGGEYYNSIVSLGLAPAQVYRKSHLVPFGEFIPLRPVLGGIVSRLAIPLQDFARGPAAPQPLAVAGQRVAASICYEDAFGEEIIRQLPAATILVNASNVAWFGRSIAPRQHLQIAQARALETGRYMLRATNTGVTAVIDPRGRVEASAPEFATAVLTRVVRGYAGATPYVRIGNYGTLALCVALLALAAFAPRRAPGKS
ncbi:MAG: apolipoprotein N-acyltransferase [Burkholderiales bacterium]|nr:apolipoprotein N-acyltransferase [Burkholderiales bacterium]